MTSAGSPATDFESRPVGGAAKFLMSSSGECPAQTLSFYWCHTSDSNRKMEHQFSLFLSGTGASRSLCAEIDRVGASLIGSRKSAGKVLKKWQWAPTIFSGLVLRKFGGTTSIKCCDDEGLGWQREMEMRNDSPLSHFQRSGISPSVDDAPVILCLLNQLCI